MAPRRNMRSANPKGNCNSVLSAATQAALQHRGPSIVEYPSGNHWDALGGREGIESLIQDLYRRIEQDEILSAAFPHFNSGNAASFFIQWLGGDSGYADDFLGGVLRRHQHRFVSATTAAAWIRCFRGALEARGLNRRDPVTEQIIAPLSRIAKAMIHSPNQDKSNLCHTCDAVQDSTQSNFDGLLRSVSKGHADAVEVALNSNPHLAKRRGIQNQTLAWAATYANRPKVLQLILDAEGDCNSPGCDHPTSDMACNSVHLGTGVCVTPLAIAKKWHPKLVSILEQHGAIDDVFTAAWLGDTDGVRNHLHRDPELLQSIDPADDFHAVNLLTHAVFSGNISTVTLLVDSGIEVVQQSGKALTLAVLMNRRDLVELLVDAGANVERTHYLGRLDDVYRPVADFLIARGKRVPDWMLPKACRPDVSSNELHRVQVLLDYGANLNDRGRFGLTALHYAVRGGNIPLIQLLLDRGANPNAYDTQGLPPIIQLSKTRSKADPVPVLELLHTRGADINARDENQTTLLMYYARQSHVAAVRWLVAHGADRQATNKSGKTAVQIALKAPEVQRLLRDR